MNRDGQHVLNHFVVVRALERFDPQQGRQFGEVFTASRAAHGVCVPVVRREIELRGNQFQDTCAGRLTDAQRPAGVTQIHHLHRNAQAVGQTAMLTNEGEV